MTTTNNTKGNSPTQIMTPKGRVSFPSVFTPRKPLNPADEPKYGLTLLFDLKDPEVKAGLEKMKEFVISVATAKWGPDKTKWPKGLRMPFRDGKEKDFEGYGDGIIFVAASSKQKPGIVYPWAGTDGKPAPLTNPGDFYAGCFARATLSAYAYDKGGNRGVAFGLRNVQKLSDGEAFSGKTAAENDFDPIETAPVAMADADGTAAAAPSVDGMPF